MSHTHETAPKAEVGKSRKIKKTCSEDDCDDAVRSLGRCSKHYVRFWRGGGSATKKECEVKYCGRPYHSGGYCRGHFDHFRRYGDPILKNPRGPLGMVNPRASSSGFELPSRPKLDMQLAHERKTQCNHEGCDEQQYAKLLCPFHYARSWDQPHHTKLIGMSGRLKRDDSHIIFNSRVPIPN